MTEKCVVIGAGINGLFTALELSKAGLQVCLLERTSTTQEASWAGSGIVSPLQPWREVEALNQLSLWSQQHYPTLIDEMELHNGISAGLLKSGLLVIEEEEVTRAREWASDAQIPHQDVTPEQLQAMEPALRSLSHNALYLPEISQVRNPRLLRLLWKELRRRDVEVLSDTEVNEISIQQGAVTGLQTQRGELAAELVVLAAGAWSSGLLGGWQVKAETVPVRGQILMYRLPAGRLQRMALQRDSYLVPRADGVLLAGSTVEYVGFDKSTTSEARKDLHDMAVTICPELSETPIEGHWAGLRPGCSSGLPMIGAHPSVTGLYLNCGHFRTGLTLAPASARLLCDTILGRPSELNGKVFTPEALESSNLAMGS